MKQDTDSSVRVRFAPSPTGSLHIGSLRAALFNWLFARHNKGLFLVRIEDTDRQRSTKEFEESILKSLEWTGITSDEPIIYQYDRLSIHKKIIDKLLDDGKAYKCFCSQEELQQKKEKAIDQQQTYQYDKKCRAVDTSNQDSAQPFVIRFKVDIQNDVFTLYDQIRGEVTIPAEQIDDFIILRSDDTVTYNLAVVKDDHDMHISHVIRGEDHLLNTVKQMLLYDALGYKIPVFAHIPLILGDRGQKLSKRDAATSVIDYQKDGYLAEALCNYLVRLGWSHGNQELFTAEELIKLFTLDGVHKSGAKFDIEKLRWMNAQYIKQATPEQLINLCKDSLGLDLVLATSDWSEQQRITWVMLYQDRVHTLKELYDYIGGAYVLPASHDKESLRKIIEKDSIVILQLLQQEFEHVEFSKELLLSLIKAFCKTHEYKMAQIAQLLRFALLGTVSGPSVFDMMVLFGKKEVQRRMSHVISRL